MLSNSNFNCVRVDPHNPRYVAGAVGDQITILDTRLKIEQPFTAHSDHCLDLSYNPNKLNTLISAGGDGMVRIWDLRRFEKCVF